MTIGGKDIKGYSFADGVHWYWGDEEVAVIDQYTSEIEWCNRKFHFPKAVIQAVRDLRPRAAGTWLIEAKRISRSVTQGSINIRINGESLISFDDEKKIGEDGEYHSQITDEELGRLVCSAFWHPYDSLYHYADKAQRMFYPARNCQKSETVVKE